MNAVMSMLAGSAATAAAISLIIGLADDSREQEAAPCKAQIVEYVRDGGRCSFIPVQSVLNGYLDNGVCITAEVGK